MDLSKTQVDKLETIVLATQGEPGFVFMTPKNVAVLVDAGYVECNGELTDPTDPKKVAVRATQSGLAYHPSNDTPSATQESMTMDNASFEIETAPLPARKRGSNKASIYPFDLLEVGQRFFVPATEDRPNPAKALASTVSSASKRYATENGTRMVNRRNKETGEMEQVAVKAYNYSRKFSVVAGEKDGVQGAFVGRVALEDSDE